MNGIDGNVWHGYSIELYPLHLFLKFTREANQNEAVGESGVFGNIRSFSRGTEPMTLVAPAAQHFFTKVRNVILLHCTALTAWDRQIRTFAKLQLSVSV